VRLPSLNVVCEWSSQRRGAELGISPVFRQTRLQSVRRSGERAATER
jgi:hypothetical protein